MGWMAHEHRAAVERPSPRRSGIGATRGDDEAERVGQRREELAEAADLGGEFPSTRCVALSRHAWSVRWILRIALIVRVDGEVLARRHARALDPRLVGRGSPWVALSRSHEHLVRNSCHLAKPSWTAVRQLSHAKPPLPAKDSYGTTS